MCLFNHFVRIILTPGMQEASPSPWVWLLVILLIIVIVWWLISMLARHEPPEFELGSHGTEHPVAHTVSSEEGAPPEPLRGEPEKAPLGGSIFPEQAAGTVIPSIGDLELAATVKIPPQSFPPAQAPAAPATGEAETPFATARISPETAPGSASYLSPKATPDTSPDQFKTVKVSPSELPSSGAELDATVKIPTASVLQPPQAAILQDDLTKIEGIGPRINSLLQTSGIQTYTQLADTDVSYLRQILDENGLKFIDPGTWAEQARLAAEGKWEEFEKLTQQLKGGRRVR